MNEHNIVRVLTALCCDPWLITPSMHKTLTEIAIAHARGDAAQHNAAAMMGEKPPAKRFAMLGDAVAVIPVEGVIGRKFSSVLYSSGVTSVDVLSRLIDMAANDEEVNGILLNFDSPGGTVQGVREAANAVRRARESKPVLAYGDGRIHSAAYWIASQATGIYAWDESRQGSIGVYCAVLDQSRQFEQEGVKVEMFKSGKDKGMGYPGTSLTDEQRKMIQAEVDAIGVEFRSAVRDGRKRNIKDEDMQGQDFSASDSLKNGLIDQISDFQMALRDAGKLGRVQKQKKG